MIDSFMFFVFQSIKHIKNKAYFGMILPDVILYQLDNANLREYLLTNCKIEKVINLGNVFESVVRPSCVITLQNTPQNGGFQVLDISNLDKPKKSEMINNHDAYLVISFEQVSRVPNHMFVTSNPTNYLLWEKSKGFPYKTLNEFVDSDGIQRGISPDLKKAFIVDIKTIEEFRLENEKLKPVLTGGIHVKRSHIENPNLFIIYTSDKDNFALIPNICGYINHYKNEITCKEVKQKKHSIYSLHRARQESIFLKNEKVIGVITEDEIVAAVDKSQIYVTDGLYLFGVKEEIDIYYVLALT